MRRREEGEEKSGGRKREGQKPGSSGGEGLRDRRQKEASSLAVLQRGPLEEQSLGGCPRAELGPQVLFPGSTVPLPSVLPRMTKRRRSTRKSMQDFMVLRVLLQDLQGPLGNHSQLAFALLPPEGTFLLTLSPAPLHTHLL